MDIYKEWDRLNEQKFSKKTLQKEQIMNSIYLESNSAISKLKKALRIKSYWTLFFISIFSLGMVYFRGNPEVLMIIGFVNFLYLVGYILIYKNYSKMDDGIDADGDLLSNLESNERSIKSALKMEQYVFGWFMPVSILIGMLFSGLMKGESISDKLSDPKFLLAALVAVIVITPIMNFAAKKANEKGFGSHLKDLEENIKKLKWIEE